MSRSQPVPIESRDEMLRQAGYVGETLAEADARHIAQIEQMEAREQESR